MSAVQMHEMLERTALLVQRDIFPALSLEEIADGLSGVTVRLSADRANVGCPAARTAVVGTAIVLAQSGARVELDVADVAFREPQPPLRGDRLATALHAHLRRLPSAGPPGAPDVILMFGDTAADGTAGVGGAAEPLVLRLAGDGFTCELDGNGTPGRRWSGEAPFGGLLGACAAGAEAFRLAMRRLSVVHGAEPLLEHRLTPSARVRLAVPPLALPLDVAALFDLISGGAITNGALIALQRLAGLQARGRVFDDDHVALNNLNRYGLLSFDDLERPKVDALAALTPAGWDLEPVRERLNEENATGGLSDVVLVGVDHIPSRWLAQRHAPDWLCVAGTSHFFIVVSEHVPGGPCAGCMHPRDEPDNGPIPTIAFVSMLAGVLQAHRLARHLAGEAPAPPMIVWPMALDAREGMLTVGESARADCPVGCAASREVAPRRAA